jgi:hypothetical protein
MEEIPKDPNALPKGLWLGTAIFMLVAAIALIFTLQVGQKKSEASSTAKIELKAVELTESEQSRADEENRLEPAP